MAEQEITYEQVAQAAETIINRNERVTIERVRRLVGYGDMIKIVGFLRRWQKEKDNSQSSASSNVAPEAQKSSEGAKKTTKDEVVVVVGSNGGSHKSRNRRLQPFSFERLDKEPVIIRALFWALFNIRSQKNCAIELHQHEKNTMTEMMMSVEDEIRNIKRSAKEEINQLMQQYCKISLQYDSERKKLR